MQTTNLGEIRWSGINLPKVETQHIFEMRGQKILPWLTPLETRRSLLGEISPSRTQSVSPSALGFSFPMAGRNPMHKKQTELRTTGEVLRCCQPGRTLCKARQLFMPHNDSQLQEKNRRLQQPGGVVNRTAVSLKRKKPIELSSRNFRIQLLSRIGG